MRILLALTLLLTACAQGDSGSSSSRDGGTADALVSGGGDVNLGESDTKLLFYRLGDDGFVASAAGTGPTLICEGGTPFPDADGGRALCVPDDPARALTLYDTDADLVLAEYPGWERGSVGRPHVSPDGSKVVFVTRNDEGKKVVRMADDGGNVLGEVEAFDVLAFPGGESAIIDTNRPTVWRPNAEPVPINDVDFAPIGPDPVGAVYMTFAPENRVIFLDGETGQTRDLGLGELGGAFNTRVLIQTSPEEARLIDLADPRLEFAVPLPMTRFDEFLGTRLSGRRGVLIQYERPANCMGRSSRLPQRTLRYDIARDDEEAVEVADTTPTTHVAHVDDDGRRALVLEVDICGNPSGAGYVRNLATGEDTPLTDLLDNPVLDGRISPDGRFVALGLPDGLVVVDLDSNPPVPRAPAGTGRAGPEMFFR